MNLEQFAQMRALEAAYTWTNRAFVDRLLSGDQAAGTLRSELSLKRIQFDTLSVVSDELERVCTLLEVSKRQFLEGAVVEALYRAEKAYRQTLDQMHDELAESSGVHFTLEKV